jgi:hypothetical protein
MSTDWIEQQKLEPSDIDPGSQFGKSTSIYGNTLVVGAPFSSKYGSGSGIAYVFVRSGTSWSLQAELISNDIAQNDFFGTSVSIYEDTIVIGSNEKDASGTYSGKAYVFVRSGTTWSQQAELLPNDIAQNDFFGTSVSIYEDTLVVGSPGKDASGTDSGKAYVFVRSGTSWSQQAGLLPNDIAQNDFFGFSVSIYNNTIVVGANGKDASGIDSGKAYVFVRSGTSWSQQAGLLPNDIAQNDFFGYSVSIYNNTIVVGANVKNNNSGKAYVFVQSGTSWSQQAGLLPNDISIGDQFGQSVSIYNNTIIVGAPRKDASGNSSGKAYVFVRSVTSWSQQEGLLPDDIEPNDTFGQSVSIYNNTIVGGAPNFSTQERIGKAYIFIREEPEPPIIPPFIQNEECECSEKICYQGSYIADHDDSKVINVRNNRIIASSFNKYNITDSVRGRQFVSYNDYLHYLQANLKYN